MKHWLILLPLALSLGACDDKQASKPERVEKLWQDDDYLPPVRLEIITPPKTKKAAVPIPLDGRAAPRTRPDGKHPRDYAEAAREIYLSAGGRE